MIKITKAGPDLFARIDRLLNREETSYERIDALVSEILKEVKAHGNKAVIDYTERFDGVRLVDISVSREELDEALRVADPEFVTVLEQAKERIRDYHQMQMERSWYSNQGGVWLGQHITPIERVGVYVPGGKAAYPSTVLMNVIPAKVAGVKEIALVSPPDRDGKVHPAVLVAASVTGVKEIYKAGGAQAIAALTYGTETIKPVQKIVGPGNMYVARAKRMVFGKVDIDMIAGPSEICVIADDSANPAYIAADLLSQAEHDEMAAPIFITDSPDLAERVKEEIGRQLVGLKRRDIAEKALDRFGHIFLTTNLDEAFDLANEIAPEHLELLVDNAFERLTRIKHAGAIFIGPYSPEPLGDYFAGPNHTLPTGGTAKFSSPLGTYDFFKRSSVIFYGRRELERVKDGIIRFANEEGLSGHANSIRIRFEK